MADGTLLSGLPDFFPWIVFLTPPATSFLEIKKITIQRA
jgi:hypothetical protein